MKKSLEKQIAGVTLFNDAVKMMPILEEIPLSEIRADDISLLQRLSETAKHDGICIIVGVNFYDKNLVAMHFVPDLKSNPPPSFANSPDTVIFIGNNYDPDHAALYLRNLSINYDCLNAPAYQVYDDGDETVPRDEFILANAKAKYEHEKFMKKNCMHYISLPYTYKF